MTTDGRSHIVAISGGSFVPDDRGELTPSPLLRYARDLTDTDRPRVCFVTTAVGDHHEVLSRFYAGFSRWEAEVSHLALYPWPNHADLAAHLLSQDMIYVTGGSVANLRALWRVHGVDEVMRRAWESGVVLCGQSAGSLCWHVGGPTDSFGPELAPFTDGLGLLPYSNGVHYDAEPRRRPLMQRLVADGTLPAGYAADNGVALHYVGTELVQAIGYVPEARAYRVESDGAGGAKEVPIEPRRLAG
ncbi:peptidase E [Allonocardiopsis opalescens]|uniref:Peptidase E n=1 Tax=Allonocardiopsis opalescens TaxID=1144618 RepID=A0A2T0PZZ2_9ACTN|nr:peptidase E [Allonocardiopsis opalescens]PRX97107.1 peptidase E [Allonocardiopsis opalescens]